MSATRVDILLVGGGVAAATAAAELRARGFEGSIGLVTREATPPYHRPPITKGLLTGREVEQDGLVHEDAWWAEQDVTLRTRTSVMALDPARRTAALATKDEIAFGSALVATGAMVRRLRVDGAQREGVHYLRTPANARALRGELEAAERAVIVGGSFIGTEVAASLTMTGTSCTLLMQEQRPLERTFGALVGDFAAGLLRDRGVEVIGGEDVVAFEGDTRVAAVRTASGRRVDADVVVVGAGAVPDVALARRAGLEIGETGGVHCDSFLHTSAAHIYAAGDMCEYDSPLHGRRLRVEHEEHAIAQGRTAARNLLGEETPHLDAPYFWSELGDWAKLESLGPVTQWDDEWVTGSVDSGCFTVWYMRDDRVVGSVSVGQAEMLDAARRLIAERAPSGRVRDLV